MGRLPQEAHHAATTLLNEKVDQERQAREAAEARALELVSSRKDSEDNLEAKRNNMQELEMNVQTRIADIATLTANYEKDLANAETKCLKLNKQLDTHLSTIVVLTKRVEKQDTELQKFFKSTSWKITAPARKVIDKVRGNQKPIKK